MDSLTQIVLGAGVAEAALGKKIGRKASLYGAVLGTLPDLDVLWVKDAVSSFTEHRSFTHSLIVLLLVSPFFAWILRRWHPRDIQQKNISFLYWFISIYAVFATHALLDWFTVYGTQLFWPLTTYPYAVGSIFIVDPVYTIPFLVLLLATIISRKRWPVILGLTLSSIYLAWSVYAQNNQHQYFEQSFASKGIKVQKSLTLPMPLNTLLWKHIAIVDGGYWVGFRSVFDDDESTSDTRFFKSEEGKLATVENSEPVQKLSYFTKGFYQVKQLDNDIWMSDLRMGGFGNFVFNFNVAYQQEGKILPKELNDVKRKGLRPSKDESKKALSLMKQRIVSSKVDLFPLFDSAEMLVD